MPLTDPRNPNEFLQAPQPQPYNQSLNYPSNQADMILKELHATREQQAQLNHQIALRLEAIRRCANIEEADLITTEKAILEERRAPAPQVTIETVIQVTREIVTDAIEQNNNELRTMLRDILQTTPQSPDPMNQPHHYQEESEEIPTQSPDAPAPQAPLEHSTQGNEAPAAPRPPKQKKDAFVPDWKNKGH